MYLAILNECSVDVSHARFVPPGFLARVLALPPTPTPKVGRMQVPNRFGGSLVLPGHEIDAPSG